MHPSLKKCIDNNECMSNPCNGMGRCFNVQGSYRCGCPDGYQFDSLHQVCLQVMKFYQKCTCKSKIFLTQNISSQASAGCSGSPCFFGCTAVGNSGFQCGCPQGYHVVGMYCFF